jgi:hypothetical protein
MVAIPVAHVRRAAHGDAMRKSATPGVVTSCVARLQSFV